jgi:hypothetical protein
VAAQGSATASRHERGRPGDEEGKTERRNRETSEVEWKLHPNRRERTDARDRISELEGQGDTCKL